MADLLERFDIPTAEAEKESAQAEQKEKTSEEDSNCAEVGLCADEGSSSFSVEVTTEDNSSISAVTVE